MSPVSSARGMTRAAPPGRAGVGPAHQSLDAYDLVTAQVDLGLVVDHELALFNGPMQLCLEAETFPGVRAHALVEEVAEVRVRPLWPA